MSRICATASCRQELDVCASDDQCCMGHCRPIGTCGPNRPPVADAGPDAAVNKRQTVGLGGSSDPDGDPLSYTWSLSRPTGSAATLSSPSSASPSFVTDVVGTYLATVTVSDGQYTSTDSATITVVNSPPIARAGADRDMTRNNLAQISDSSSSDPDGDALSFTWTISGPPGSTAALSSTTTRETSFTPDLLGDYLLTLVVSDGELSSSDSVVITAINVPPVPRITGVAAVNARETVTLSAASSTDANADPLTYSWMLAGPYGTTAVLSNATGPTTSFTTDLTGSYTVTLVASDGVDTRSTWRSVQAHPQMTKLTHDVVGAAYSRVMDRLVTISTTPANALWILDPTTAIEQRVDLPAGPPLSVGVSADGLVAVVGRNGGVTEIDLVTASSMADCTTQWTDGTTTWNYDAAAVAVGPELTLGTGKNTRVTRFAYSAPGFVAHRGDYTLGLDLGTCVSQADWVGSYFEGTAALRPGNGELYVLDYSYNDTFYIYSMPSGSLATRVAARPGYLTRSAFWFIEDGSRFLCQAGDVYDSNPVPTGYSAQSLTRVGALGNPGAYDPRQLVLHADHSAARQHFSVVPMNDYEQTEADTVLMRYSVSAGNPSSYPAYGASIELPKIVVNGGAYPAHGRYVFYRSDSSTRYAVIRTPLDAGFTVFAVAPMGP